MEKLLDTWSMSNAKPKRQPLEPGVDLVSMSQNLKDPEYDSTRADMSEVRSLIGGISWPAEMTRPDLSFTRAYGSRLQSDCSQSVFDALKNSL